MNQADCPYTLSRAAAGEAPAFYALMRSVYEGMPDKDLFAVGEIAPEWMQKALTPPCFGIGARTASGELAGMLVVTPEGWEHSLARKAGLSPDQLLRMTPSIISPAVISAKRDDLPEPAPSTIPPAILRIQRITPTALRNVETLCFFILSPAFSVLERVVGKGIADCVL